MARSKKAIQKLIASMQGKKKKKQVKKPARIAALEGSRNLCVKKELVGVRVMAKLCAKGKAAAKRKFKVYPSAYANMYGSAVCSGKVTPGGKKEKKKI